MGKDCDKYVFSSKNHEKYLQKVRKNTLSAFDEKRYSLIEIESLHWN